MVGHMRPASKVFETPVLFEANLVKLIIADQAGNVVDQVKEVAHALLVQGAHVDVGKFDGLELAQVQDPVVVHLPRMIFAVLC